MTDLEIIIISIILYVFASVILLYKFSNNVETIGDLIRFTGLLMIPLIGQISFLIELTDAINKSKFIKKTNKKFNKFLNKKIK